MEFKSSGTEMTLSDRFAQVRETMKKQALATNPFIGISSGKPTKNFGERFTRDQRPNASQQAASLANRNLVYQMSRQPALMAEVGHLSQPVFVSTRQARVSRHSFVGEYGDDETIATTFTVGQSHFRGRANVPITQRLGLRLAGAVTKNKASVYSRLGTKPIHLRLGSRPRGMCLMIACLSGLNICFFF